MPNPLTELSDQLAAAVEAAGQSIVAVNAHPRLPASGIHWRPGVIVSTAHTLKSHTSVEITFPDNTTQTAELAGQDPATDLAVFRLESPNLPTAAFAAPGPLRPGQLALAIGRSRTAGATASMGVLSAVGGPWRTWQGGQISQRLQVDIGLYPSSNGGAVVDAAGRVIGLATGAFSRFGAIAVPAATIDRALENLLTTGYIPQGYLGVGLRPVPLPPAYSALLPTPSDFGLIVLSIEPGSAAAQAGLYVGDIVTSINGTATREPDDVQSHLGPDSIGKALSVSVLRGGTPLNLTITAGERRPE